MLATARIVPNEANTFVAMAMLIVISGVAAAVRTPTTSPPGIGAPVVAVVWTSVDLPFAFADAPRVPGMTDA